MLVRVGGDLAGVDPGLVLGDVRELEHDEGGGADHGVEGGGVLGVQEVRGVPVVREVDQEGGGGGPVVPLDVQL